MLIIKQVEFIKTKKNKLIENSEKGISINYFSWDSSTPVSLLFFILKTHFFILCLFDIKKFI